jgi:hypothetical protein
MEEPMSRRAIALAAALMTSGAMAAPSPNLPLSFIPNAGQTDPAVLFVAKSSGPDLFFTRDAVTYSQAPDSRGAGSVVRVRGCGSLHRTLDDVSVQRADVQRAVVADRDALGAFDGEANRRHVRARREDEVALESSLAAGPAPVDAGEDGVVHDARRRR